MVFSEIAYYPILGIPLIIYGGITTLILLIITAIYGMFVLKGKGKMKYHKILAITTIIIASVHGLLGLLARLIG